MFVFQVVANLGLYGPGVILIREAHVRWKKGWATVLILGAAYGILEEGVGLSTLYNPLANPVGKLGFYGHYLGVNWVWVAGILPVHMIFSISLPILLLGLAFPETNGKSLVTTKRKIAATFAILAADVSILFLVVLRTAHFWMGWPIFVSSFVAIGLLVAMAKRAPRDLLHAKTVSPKAGARKMGFVGALFYTSVILTEFVGMGAHVPAAIDFFLVIVVQAAFLLIVLNLVGSKGNERQLISLAFGLVLPIAAIGLIAEAKLPLIVVVDALFGIFIWKLFKKYSSEGPKAIEGYIDATKSQPNST